MIEEVKKLNKSGISFKRLEELGLEYRYVAKYLQGKLSEEEMRAQLLKAIFEFARRQIQWLKNKDVHWVKNYREAEKLVKKFL